MDTSVIGSFFASVACWVCVTSAQLAVLYEVLDAIERDLQQLDARHYPVLTPHRSGRAD